MSSNDDGATGLVAPSSTSFQVTTVGLRFNGVIPYEEWEAIGPVLGKGARGYSWSIGDWLAYGEHTYGEKYAQAMESTGLSRGRLQNLSWLASSVPFHVRVEDLSLSHHEAAAPLPVKHQETMLRLAVEHSIDRDTFRDLVAEVLAGLDPDDVQPDVTDSEQRVITPKDIIEKARAVAVAWRENYSGNRIGMTLHAALVELAEITGDDNE